MYSASCFITDKLRREGGGAEQEEVSSAQQAAQQRLLQAKGRIGTSGLARSALRATAWQLIYSEVRCRRRLPMLRTGCALLVEGAACAAHAMSTAQPFSPELPGGMCSIR